MILGIEKSVLKNCQNFDFACVFSCHFSLNTTHIAVEII